MMWGGMGGMGGINGGTAWGGMGWHYMTLVAWGGIDGGAAWGGLGWHSVRHISRSSIIHLLCNSSGQTAKINDVLLICCTVSCLSTEPDTVKILSRYTFPNFGA